MGYSKKGEADDIRWDDYRAFEAIAKTSSIKRAAAVLGVTQPALSKRLARLEQALGVRLVERGPRGATLTYEGERVLVRVLAADKELTSAAHDAHMAKSRVEGNCSIVLADGIANYWLSYFVASFLNSYPEIELKIFVDHDLGGSKNDVFDIRLHYYQPIDPAQVMRPLASVHFIPFASRSYIEKFGMPRSADDIAAHRVVDQSQHLASKGSWPAWFGDDMYKRTSLFTNQSAFLAKCVRRGAGIALMPTYMTIADPEFVPLDLGVSLPAKLYASYSRDRVVTQPVKTTLSFLRTIAFNPKSMPWFEESFRFPDPSWPGRLQAVMDRLAAKSAGAEQLRM